MPHSWSDRVGKSGHGPFLSVSLLARIICLCSSTWTSSWRAYSASSAAGASALTAELRSGLAYAQLQSAVGRIRNTMGRDPLPGAVAEQDLATLMGVIEAHMTALTAQHSSEQSAPVEQ